MACYPWSASVHDDHAATTPEERLRLWYQTRALCGDVIVEQDIHAIDVATWFAGADPIKAVGTGSKSTRKYGDVWGHFAVLYTFPDNFQVSFTSQKNVPGALDEIRCLVYGSEGVADTDYIGAVQIRGKHPYEGGRMNNLYTSGAQRNIEELLQRHHQRQVRQSHRRPLRALEPDGDSRSHRRLPRPRGDLERDDGRV